MATLLLKPIIEHLAIDLIHNVKILLVETIRAMAHTKQFKRFVEKMFLITSNVSLEVIISEMKDMTRPPIEGSDADKFRGFMKGVKDKINDTKVNSVTPKVNEKLIKKNIFQKPNIFVKRHQKGGTDTSTKYVIEPHIFPNIPDITPELIKKYLYTPIEPFLRVMTCKDCNGGMFVRIKNKIICNLMKLFTKLITILFKTGIFNSTIVYGSYKKILNKLAEDPANLQEPGGKIPRLIDIFEKQLTKNNKRLDEIEEEEVVELENLTGATDREKQIRENMEKRNAEIDEATQILEGAIGEITDDEFLPGKERDPQNVLHKMPTALDGIDAKIDAIDATLVGSQLIKDDPKYVEKMKAAAKNADLKKRAKKLISDLKTVKRLPYYDEGDEKKDPDLDPKNYMKKIKEELHEINKQLGKGGYEIVSDTPPLPIQTAGAHHNSTFKNRHRHYRKRSAKSSSGKSIRAIAA